MQDIELIKGDCLEIMKNIPDNSIDMILCDLPYAITNLAFDKYIIPFNQLWEQYDRIIKPNGAILLFAKQPFTTDLICSNRKRYRYNLTWLKNIANGFLNAKVMPLKVTEDICVFYNYKPTYNPQMETGFERKVSKASSKRKCQQTEIYNKAICVKDYDSTERYPIDVLYFQTDKHRQCLHPTQKPVALLEYLIKTYSNENELILDNCMGSGSTGVACVNTNRKFIGIELDDNYFQIAQKRIDDAISEKKSKLF